MLGVMGEVCSSWYPRDAELAFWRSIGSPKQGVNDGGP